VRVRRRVIDRPAALPGAGPRPGAGPTGLGGLADLADLLGGDSPRSHRFLGGLVVGALVGAALAGGSLVRLGKRASNR
jgi:hypothetical protein